MNEALNRTVPDELGSVDVVRFVSRIGFRVTMPLVVDDVPLVLAVPLPRSDVGGGVEETVAAGR